MLFRKIATILLLTFLFFTWVGYWLFIPWFESREAVRWEHRLDNEQYNAGQLVLFKVSAAALPYSNPSAAFERADGEISIGDIHYRCVRKRLYNDSIEFLCLPCRESTSLRTAKRDILRLTAGIPDNGNHGRSSPVAKASQILLQAFWQAQAAFDIGKNPAAAIAAGGRPETETRPGHTRIGKQPPRRATTLSI